MNNNMNFNWEKKISLKEIAQFYEDKLRELDGKQNAIISNLVKENEELTSKVERLNANLQLVSNFLSQYRDIESDISLLITKEIDEKSSNLLDEAKKAAFDRIETVVKNIDADFDIIVNRLKRTNGEYFHQAMDFSSYLHVQTIMVLFSFLHNSFPKQYYSKMEELIDLTFCLSSPIENFDKTSETRIKEGFKRRFLEAQKISFAMINGKGDKKMKTEVEK